MGKRKGRAARNAKKSLTSGEPEELVKAPHSFVINRGKVGKNVSELMLNFRKIMEPYTASHLKVLKSNVLKDFVHTAGILNVTHLVIFTKTKSAIYLRIAKLPHGPTLTYKINEYSLMKDIISSQKKSVFYEKLFQHHPLLVLNNFSGEGMQFKLMTTMFQNMFPSINIYKTNLNTIRRCLLLNYNDDKTIDLRQYTIKIVPAGVSKAVKKLIQNKVPNLSQFHNIDEFMQKSGNLSESEVELDSAANTVVLPQPISSRGNIASEKSAIRLYEIGPRLKLQLIKIEEGLMTGDVLFHEFIHRTPEEIKALKEKIKAKKLLKEKRRAEQKKNVEKKKKVAEAMAKDKNDEIERENEREEDIDWYRKEVGEDPDENILPGLKKRKGTGAKGKIIKKRKIDIETKKEKPSVVKTKKMKTPEIKSKKGKSLEMKTKKMKTPEGKSKKENSDQTSQKQQTMQDFMIKRKKRKEAKLAKKASKRISHKVLAMKAKHKTTKVKKNK